MTTEFLALMEYGLRILPGLTLLVALLLVFRGRRTAALDTFVLLLGFVLVRDAMTPAGFWTFGVTDGVVPWLRFVDDPLVLLVLGSSSLAVTGLLVWTLSDLREYLEWGHLDWQTVLFGLAGAVIIVAPLVAVYQFVPVGERGGSVARSMLPTILWMSMTGNLAEEVLFRGHLQGYLETIVGPVRAVLGSALFFAAGHVYLATTVTNLGPVLVAFTLYEGVVCAYVRMHRGIWPAAIAHGVTIFVLASGFS